jgi:hypothetical protein
VHLARRFRAITLKKENDPIVVGLADPTDIYAYNEIWLVPHLTVRYSINYVL